LKWLKLRKLQVLQYYYYSHYSHTSLKTYIVSQYLMEKHRPTISYFMRSMSEALNNKVIPRIETAMMDLELAVLLRSIAVCPLCIVGHYRKWKSITIIET